MPSLTPLEQITNITGNPLLAGAICDSLNLAARTPFVCLDGSKDEWEAFERSLNAAIYDIEGDPAGRGELFKRFIRYGPHDPGDPIAESGDGQTHLSDPECCACVEFIFSHMINRFQGELGELLALAPCIRLVEKLQADGKLPENSILYWGNTVRERRKASGDWKGFVKGADGLLVSEADYQTAEHPLSIQAVVEIKSMPLSHSRMLRQIDHHLSRLAGGLVVAGKEYPSQRLVLDRRRVLKIMVRPATWKVDREVVWQRSADGGISLIYPEPQLPPVGDEVKEITPNQWAITLAWSADVLRQAAFEMTFGYMGEIGDHVFTEKTLPKGWEDMDPDEAGYNSSKMMLYYLIHRIHEYTSRRQHKISQKERKALRLYNIYSYGYALGADSKYMLWPPENVPNGKEGGKYELVEMKREPDDAGNVSPWWDGIEGD